LIGIKPDVSGAPYLGLSNTEIDWRRRKSSRWADTVERTGGRGVERSG
jgi:hypothetical protein